ncbi:MAG: hypothetical protein US50_C0069G0002 [Candidatus Nomurabacteria bacterium GW2011_GWB1_37_5]|uniref:DUF11 domain-containing protein n=1 Tax=Candidatus Nomurabacteria bacterium GW2011_GWB1_37_5 TaxID=1618742 RepID=A0A0G0GS30_9BACT|nr:MAG: hypothetical protein US50_C0069G0002 [Candidatus Nomurabacteria bacterium GW2011_GWB1_37_5]
MANEDLNKINRLEEIQRKLYSRTDPVHRKKDKKMDSISYGVPTGWGEEDSTGSSRSDLGTSRGPTSSRPGVGSEKMTEDGPFRHPMNKARPRSSIFKKFFYFSLLVLAGALVFSFFKIYKGGNVVSPENIDIIISANPFIQSGEEFDTEVSILNRNTSQIEVNSLALEYQKGFISSETPSQSPPYEGGEGVERKKFNIENVASGGTSLGNAKITLFGEQGSKRELKATLEYRIAGSSATFVKVQTFEVTFSSSPLIFTIDAPSSVNPNQDVTLSIKIASNTNTISKDMLVKAVYPIGFQFKESTPMPFVSDNVWFLGDLNPSAEKSIIIKGSMLGETGETKIINVLVGEKDKSSETGISTLYGSLTKTFLLEAPSLLVNLLVGGRDQAEYAFQSQKTVNASLSWANNQPGRLNDMEVRVKITGNALNKNSIKVKNGFYDIANDVLVWDKETIPAFASVEPGTQGILEFEFSSTSTQFPSLVVSPQIELLASISANRPNESNFFESIANSDT